MPTEGQVFLSLNDNDKPKMGSLAKDLSDLGFGIVATKGTAEYLRSQGLAVEDVFKVGEGRPNVVDLMINGEVHWIINTPLGMQSKFDELAIRRGALEHGLPIMTTLAAARAGVEGLRAIKEQQSSVRTLQEYHAEVQK